ncbi:hypothetical protein ACFLWB_02980 [Chloroflexota bacterium]
MIRPIIFSSVLAISLLFSSGPTYAQNEEPQLPRPGISPDSPFYFLDMFGEFLQEFFTFNSEAKVKLQLAFAAERIAEMKEILETKGTETKGLKEARARLETHAAKATDITEKEKGKGKDISAQAGEIVDNFHWQRKAIKQVFNKTKQEFSNEREVLHNQLLDSIKIGDTIEEEHIRQELTALEAEKDAAETEKDEAIHALEAEKERLQDELGEIKREEDAARDAAEETERVRNEAEEHQYELERKTLEVEVTKEVEEKLRKIQEEENEEVSVTNEGTETEEESVTNEGTETEEESVINEETETEGEVDRTPRTISEGGGLAIVMGNVVAMDGVMWTIEQGGVLWEVDMGAVDLPGNLGDWDVGDKITIETTWYDGTYLVDKAWIYPHDEENPSGAHVDDGGHDDGDDHGDGHGDDDGDDGHGDDDGGDDHGDDDGGDDHGDDDGDDNGDDDGGDDH